MKSSTFFFIFIPILSLLLLFINLVLAPHNPYQEKDSAFECGFNSFLNQNRTQFSISFFIFALLFLIFDIEVTVMFPYCVSSYHNDIYGLSIFMLFLCLLTAGFVFELGKKALNIESKQTLLSSDKDPLLKDSFINLKLSDLKLSDKLNDGIRSQFIEKQCPHCLQQGYAGGFAPWGVPGTTCGVCGNLFTN